MYSKKKLLIFHNKTVIEHLEQQSNQSSYVENLISNNIHNQNSINHTTIESNVYHLLNEIKQHISKISIIPIKNEEIELNNNDNSTSSSIMNILNFK
jgi:hypothetical protein